VNPDVGKLLIETTIGRIALAVGIGFELVGLYLIRRLGVVEV
jgi:Flp pilus assembly protein TadB